MRGKRWNCRIAFDVDAIPSVTQGEPRRDAERPPLVLYNCAIVSGKWLRYSCYPGPAKVDTRQGLVIGE